MEPRALGIIRISGAPNYGVPLASTWILQVEWAWLDYMCLHHKFYDNRSFSWLCCMCIRMIVGISRLPLCSPETKCHLDVGFVERHKIYYKGEGGGFPQVRGMMSLVNLSLPMAHLSTKSAPTMHWPTCCLLLCRSMWVIKCLSFFLIPFRSSSTPLYPSKCYKPGSVPQLLTLPLFHFIFTFESIKELGSVSSLVFKSQQKIS